MKTRACLLLHGFTGGPYEIEPLAKHLRELGWTCRIPTLAGHGGDLHRLGFVKRSDWIGSAEMAAGELTNLYGSFDLIGFSMSGLIAAYLANRYPVRKLILLNAAVIYISPRRLADSIRHNIRRRDFSEYVRKNGTPFSAVVQFMRLVHELKPEFAKVKIPSLVIQGGRDHVVHPGSARFIMSRLAGPKELRVYPDSRHMICSECEADEVFAAVQNFLAD